MGAVRIDVGNDGPADLLEERIVRSQRIEISNQSAKHLRADRLVGVATTDQAGTKGTASQSVADDPSILTRPADLLTRGLAA